jgi:hypothetical protein
MKRSITPKIKPSHEQKLMGPKVQTLQFIKMFAKSYKANTHLLENLQGMILN